MALIGFKPELRHSRHFWHPGLRKFIEFPSGPLMVGEEPPKEIRKIVYGSWELALLSPTDCVKDRLLWVFNDPNRTPDHPCLAQAMMVVRQNDIDWQELERWAANEGELGAFQQFEEDAHLDKIVEDRQNEKTNALNIDIENLR